MEIAVKKRPEQRDSSLPGCKEIGDEAFGPQHGRAPKRGGGLQRSNQRRRRHRTEDPESHQRQNRSLPENKEGTFSTRAAHRRRGSKILKILENERTLPLE